MVQVLKEGELGKNIKIIPETGSIALPFVVETVQNEKEVIVKEVVKPPVREDMGKKRATLRMGSEGDDVRAMQVFFLSTLNLCYSKSNSLIPIFRCIFFLCFSSDIVDLYQASSRIFSLISIQCLVLRISVG